jgi:heat shock protein HtpX
LLVTLGYVVIGGTTGILIGLAMAAVSNLVPGIFPTKLPSVPIRAQPVTLEQAPAIYDIVERLSQEAEIPMPGVYLIPSPAANAFATGRNPSHAAVAVTEGIVNMLTTEELEGVIAHELSHIINRDTLTQAVAATVGVLFLPWLTWLNGPAMAWPTIAITIVVPIPSGYAAGDYRCPCGRYPNSTFYFSYPRI